MVSKVFTVFVVVAAALGASAVPAPTSPCAQVHIIAARASGEDLGPGIVGSLVTRVRNGSSQTVSTSSVEYPATLDDYANSSAAGTAALKTLLTNQANACPNQKIVLMGYSQGAHIIGDTLAGGGGGLLLGDRTDPVPQAIAQRVTAVVQFGDPRFEAFKSWNEGTSLRSGMFSRPLTQTFPTFIRSRMKSWCDFNDLFCASGTSTIVHLSYMLRYEDDANDFVMGLIGN